MTENICGAGIVGRITRAGSGLSNKGVGADTVSNQRPLRDYTLGPVQLNSLRWAE